MYEIDTKEDLTHQNLNSNIFTPEKNQIAFSGILKSISFRQWHLTDKILCLTNNANVAKYAAMIGSFAVMGKWAYQISQKEMAAKFGQMYNVEPPAPQTISKYEKILCNLGLLDIPRHMLWGKVKTKLRVFTDKFWNMAREYAKEKLSHICPPSTLWRAPLSIIRKEHLQPKEQTDLVNYETPIRARDVIEEKPEATPAAHADRFEKREKGKGKGKNQHVLNGNHIAALKKYQGKKKPLPKHLKEILHWIMENYHIRDELAALLFFADVIRANASGDELARAFFRDWDDLTPASKLPRISALLAHMRQLKQMERIPAPAMPDTGQVTGSDLEEMIGALCMGDEYHGPLQEEYKRLAALPIDEQSEQMDLLLAACG